LSSKKEITLTDPKIIKGTIHTAITTDLEKYIFLFDNENMYKVDMSSGAVKVFAN